MCEFLTLFLVIILIVLSVLCLCVPLITLILEIRKENSNNQNSNKNEIKQAAVVAGFSFLGGIFLGGFATFISNNSGCDSSYAITATVSASLNFLAFAVLGIFSCCTSLRES